jgi:hypothetical protein
MSPNVFQYNKREWRFYQNKESSHHILVCWSFYLITQLLAHSSICKMLFYKKRACGSIEEQATQVINRQELKGYFDIIALA